MRGENVGFESFDLGDVFLRREFRFMRWLSSGLLRMFLARIAYSRVESDSSTLDRAGEIVAMIHVFVRPPSLVIGA
jgi:hypothetical protein